MTRLEAHEILDRQKRGFLCLPTEVNQALWITGDARGDFVVSSDGMEKTIHGQIEDLGETQSANQIDDMEKKRGKPFVDDLRLRMNKLKDKP
ncbi:MAG: hypothetical protein EBT92_18615 [Planctomycetes bacterium]|nr:hypothetical protein [Planctomycetota bacterium]